MGWAEIITPAALAAATVMSGGAAAPLALGAEGALGAAGAGAAGAGTAASTAAGATAAAEGAAAATTAAEAGTAATLGEAAAANPALTNGATQLANSGLNGMQASLQATPGAAAAPAQAGAAQASMPALGDAPMASGVQGGVNGGVAQSGAPMLGDAPMSGGVQGGEGLFGTPGQNGGTGPSGAPGKTGITNSQMQGIKSGMQLMNQQTGGQASAPPSGGARPVNNSNLQMASLNTAPVGARPSLAQLLYGRR